VASWLALLTVAFILNAGWELAQAPLDGGLPPTIATIGLSPLVQLPLLGAVSVLAVWRGRAAWRRPSGAQTPAGSGEPG